MEPVPLRSDEEVPVVHVSQSLTVNSGATSDIRLVLNVADKVHGSFRIFRVYGYGDKELQFRVLEGTETSGPQPVVLDLGTVVDEASFDFTAGRSGEYLLVFDNKPSSSESNSRKEIRLTYEIAKLGGRSEAAKHDTSAVWVSAQNQRSTGQKRVSSHEREIISGFYVGNRSAKRGR